MNFNTVSALELTWATFQNKRIRSLHNYGAFIENTPFYEYHYFSDLKDYWEAFGNHFNEENKKHGIFGTLFLKIMQKIY